MSNAPRGYSIIKEARNSGIKTTDEGGGNSKKWIVIKTSHRADTALRAALGIYSKAISHTEPTDEESAAFMAVLDDAIDSARRTLNQAEHNTSSLRSARIDAETARDIVAASNELSTSRAGEAVMQ